MFDHPKINFQILRYLTLFIYLLIICIYPLQKVIMQTLKKKKVFMQNVSETPLNTQKKKISTHFQMVFGLLCFNDKQENLFLLKKEKAKKGQK